MIEFISGILINKTPDYVIIKTGGLGYKVSISLNTYNSLPKLKEEILLLTYFNVSEKNQELFGFENEAEKDLFKMLISVSGIGPKIGINLLSSVQPEDFKQRLISGEVELLTSLPGIGPKTAKRIIIELKDKFTLTNKNDMPIENTPSVNSDAYFALISLGYKSNEVKNILNQLSAEDKKLNTEQKIKFALKKLR